MLLLISKVRELCPPPPLNFKRPLKGSLVPFLRGDSLGTFLSLC